MVDTDRMSVSAALPGSGPTGKDLEAAETMLTIFNTPRDDKMDAADTLIDIYTNHHHGDHGSQTSTANGLRSMHRGIVPSHPNPGVHNASVGATEPPSAADDPIPAPALTSPFVPQLRPGQVRDLQNLTQAAMDMRHSTDEVLAFLRRAIVWTDIRDSHDLRIGEVLLGMGEAASYKNAVWYLEYNAWEPRAAILQYQFDSQDRSGPHVDTTTGAVVRYGDENKSVDRTLARPGAGFDQSLLVLTYKQVGASTTRKFRPADGSEFDRDNLQHIEDLNKWRHKLIRERIGLGKAPPQAKPGKPATQPWHPLEATFLRNRYLEHDTNDKPNYEAILGDINTAFAGEYLPGVLAPREARNQASITSRISVQMLRDQPKHGPGERDRKHENAVAKGLQEREEATQKMLMDWGLLDGGANLEEATEGEEPEESAGDNEFAESGEGDVEEDEEGQEEDVRPTQRLRTH